MIIFYDPTIKGFARIHFSSQQPAYKKSPCENVLLEYTKFDKLCRIRLLYVPDFYPENIIFQYINTTADVPQNVIQKSNTSAMPPVRKVPVRININQYKSLKQLAKNENKSVNQIIQSATQDYFIAKDLEFSNDFNMGIVSVADTEFVESPISKFTIVHYYAKSHTVIMRLNDRKISYIKLASDNVNVCYDDEDLVMGFIINSVGNEEGSSFNLALDYPSKRGQNIFLPTITTNRHQTSRKDALNMSVRLSPKQLDFLEQQTNKNDVSNLINGIIHQLLSSE